jgi:8-oxo-dGTP pyrophosphatase MutT (NUDIX family)
MENKQPETVSTETVYKGKVFNVELAQIRDGENEYAREIVTHKGSCVIVPVFDDKTVALVRQYRHPAGKYLLEIPAGTLNANEPPEEGARREVEEEIGVRAGRIEKLVEFWVSPGFLSEKMHVFLATDFTESVQNLDEDEFLSIERFGFQQLFEMIKRNEIEDAKTIAGVILAGARFGFQYK